MRLKINKWEAREFLAMGFLASILLFSLYQLTVGLLHGTVRAGGMVASIVTLYRGSLFWAFGVPYVRPSSTVDYISHPILFVVVLSLFALAAIAVLAILLFVVDSKRSERRYFRRLYSRSMIDNAIRESIDDQPR